MKIEHFALNVAAPQAMAAWYHEHLGLRVVRQMHELPFTTFLADDSGRIMVEIYTNPAKEVPEYKKMNPLQLHLAFVSEDPEKDKNRLMQAGASLENVQHLQDGTHLVMLRDPWGLAVQLCKRGIPMLAKEELKADFNK